MTKSFYHKEGDSDLLIEFVLDIEEDEGSYTFNLAEITSIFDEGFSEEIDFNANYEKWEDIINEWLDSPKNYNKLVQELTSSD